MANFAFYIPLTYNKHYAQIYKMGPFSTINLEFVELHQIMTNVIKLKHGKMKTQNLDFFAII